MLNDGKTNRIAFVSYYKGEYGIHTLERKEPLHTAASSDFGAPGPIIDFQAPLQHTLVTENVRKKGTFEKMFLEGRPPVNVGVTSNGDVFGGTQVSFGDVLGDKQVNLFAASISQYRTLSLSYVNLSRRFQYALQGYSQTQFFYGQLGGVFYDPSLRAVHQTATCRSRRARCAAAARSASTRSIATAASRSRAASCSSTRQYNDPACRTTAQQYQTAALRPGGVPQRHADAARRGVHPGDDGLPRVRTARRQHDAARLRRLAEDRRHAVAPDVRRRRRATTCGSAASGLLATRIRGFKSTGDFPDFLYFGGNSELRGYDYLAVRRTEHACSRTPSCASR